MWSVKAKGREVLRPDALTAFLGPGEFISDKHHAPPLAKQSAMRVDVGQAPCEHASAKFLICEATKS